MTAIGLVNPQFARNVGMIMRAAGSFGIGTILFTGERVSLDHLDENFIARYNRRCNYYGVKVQHCENIFHEGPEGLTPVAVEVDAKAEPITTFEHPENALYLFGPEDGHLRRGHYLHCHRFVTIPAKFSLSLVTAVSIVLYDRMLKLHEETT